MNCGKFKKNIITVLMASLIMIGSCSLTLAADDMSVLSNIDGRTVTINCKTLEDDGKSITMVIAYPNKNIGDTNDTNITQTVAQMEIKKLNLNECEFTYTLPQFAPYGKYNISLSVKGTDRVITDSFYYANQTDVDAAFTAISSKINIAQTIQTSKEILNLYKIYDFSMKYNGNINYMINFIETYNFVNATQKKLKSDLEEYVAVKTVSSVTKNNIGSMLGDVSNFFSENYNTKNYTEEELEIFSKILANNTTKNHAEFHEYYNKAELLKDFNMMQWNDMDSFIAENYKKFDLDLTKYNKLIYKEKVHKALSDITITSFENFKNEFATAVEKQYTAENQSSGGGGSIGGSSSQGHFQTEDLKKEQTEVIFVDLNDAKWAEKYILSLASSEIISKSADKLFRPNDTITREEFVKLITQAVCIKPIAKDSIFKDVQTGTWYAPYINAAYENDIVSGSEGVFGIGNNITREDMAVISFRAAKNHIEFKTNKTIDFTDESNIADYALEAVYALSNRKIINGFTDGSFAPKANATRAQAAKIVYELYQLLEVK